MAWPKFCLMARPVFDWPGQYDIGQANILNIGQAMSPDIGGHKTDIWPLPATAPPTLPDTSALL